ncbi:GNAT family N-acetyltransferase [Thiofilum flexile]|uniref:GNAT family N-acetyltransferase n=1 Tax=Thiofilum flexile TaxID=125627 RepID=UPI0003780A92|nr:GNAT family N-acetyltransferase [Thiofilum flexile]
MTIPKYAIIEYYHGLPAALRYDAALLYDQAFGAKITRAVPNRVKRIHLLAQTFDTAFAVCALSGGHLIGLAGFQTLHGSLTNGLHREALQTHLGYWEGHWADRILSWYEHENTHDVLAIEGIVVHPHWRGLGIGTALLNQLRDYACHQGLQTLQLNVINRNTEARRLYERYGFVATKTHSLAYYRRWLLGFEAATTMELSLG